MIFTNYDLPKNDQNYQTNNLSLDYYIQQKATSYGGVDNSKYLSGEIYVPSLDYTLTETPINRSSGSDIADVITGDKLKFLGATAKHLKYQIDHRAKIRDDQIEDLDSKISECDVSLMNMESWAMFSNPMVEKRRSDLQNVIQRLEMEKRQEVTKC